jgi:repressor LexA
MIDAGIMPGDMVLAERGRPPRSGDIVIAEIDREWTMKYFEKRGTAVVLRPGNKKYKTLAPKEELNIAAVVTGVIRRYRN